MDIRSPQTLPPYLALAPNIRNPEHSTGPEIDNLFPISQTSQNFGPFYRTACRLNETDKSYTLVDHTEVKFIKKCGKILVCIFKVISLLDPQVATFYLCILSKTIKLTSAMHKIIYAK